MVFNWLPVLWQKVKIRLVYYQFLSKKVYNTCKSEAALHRCYYKKMFWKYSANLKEKTHAEVRQRNAEVTKKFCRIFPEHLFLRRPLEGCSSWLCLKVTNSPDETVFSIFVAADKQSLKFISITKHTTVFEIYCLFFSLIFKVFSRVLISFWLKEKCF